jgi:hypothetical protein
VGLYLLETISLCGVFVFGGFAVTGANLPAARTRGALTHPITTGIFIWSMCSTLLTLHLRHPLAGAAVIEGGVFLFLVVLLMFHQKIIWAVLTWYCAVFCFVLAIFPSNKPRRVLV